jgi:hypothetical protein
MNDKPPGLTSRESANWVAPLPDDRKPVAKDTPLCPYCNRYHGSINVGFNCLKEGIRKLRSEIQAIQGALAERDELLKSMRHFEA